MQQSDASRFVFNWGLDTCIKIRKKTGKLPSYNEVSSKLTLLKKKKEKWLLAADASSLQQSLRDLFASINMMFKTGAGFPKFKSRKRSQPHFRASCTIRLEENTIRIGKLGTFKIRRRDHRLSGRLLSIGCKQAGNGRWYASLLFEDDNRSTLSKTGRSVGIDMGSRIFAKAKSSTGKILTWRRPRSEETQLDKIKIQHRILSRTQKGSNRREKAKAILRKSYFKLQNMRKDFNHKLSHKIVNNYDRIAVEDLNIKKLMRTKSVAKRFQQASIGQFLSFLKYKAEWYGKKIIEVDPWRTSKTCSCCGHVNDIARNMVKKTAKNRYWKCQDCGEHLERDENAAINILNLMNNKSRASKKPSLRTHKTNPPGTAKFVEARNHPIKERTS